MNTPTVLSQEFVTPLSDELKTFFSKRGRRRIATSVLHKGEPVGVLMATVATDVFPTPYEHKYVWGHENSPRMSGIFITRLSVAQHARGEGFGSLLLHEAIKLGRTTVRHVYINVPAANMRARKFLRSNKFSENIFWFTPNHTLMVRYIW